MLITILAAILRPSGRQVFDRWLSVTWESSQHEVRQLQTSLALHAAS